MHIIFFTRKNNPPCQLIKKRLFKILEQFNIKAYLKIVDFDSDKEMVQRYGVIGVPTLLIAGPKDQNKKYYGILNEQEIKKILLE